MATTIHCDIVSAEKEIFSGRITMMSATGTIGELGILPGHAPLLTGIRPGPVRLTLEDGEEEVFFASGGYLEVQPGVVTILADTAARAEDLDEAAAIEAQESAERAIQDQAADFDFSLAASQLANAMAQQRTLEELKKRRGR
ncbi:MAG: F0F1 ATP synthase subunit epsilon [Gammaproteobacteria bacterium]|nr:F0F1 ATP synthase subunit epsilon [Gammaproteobacteria bacterium]MCZ6853813.1 F0F1 ATP synthase subunit epsilon [Gammaproteobacteria bacterium]